MSEELKAYLKREPEIVFEWSDRETDAKGWLVINSLKGGAAGGGTRMRKGLTKSEVIDLAKTMEIKFNVCGPTIGGAKSGIDFDPSNPEKENVLKRWFAAIYPLLKNYYGTAGDLNVDEKKEVSPMLNQLGIIHPQEGVLQGHFNYPLQIKNEILKRLKQGCELPVQSELYSPKAGTENYTVIDLVTGYGVAESIKIYYQLYHKKNLKNKTAYIQGWGNVGAAAGWYLAKAGVKILIIQDKEGYIINPNGFTYDEVTNYMNGKIDNTLHDVNKTKGPLDLKILNDLKIEIFIPAAASKLVKKEMVDVLIEGGLELISCGANVPFHEEGIIFGSLTHEIDSRISLVPDFIANCGVARLFCYLMENEGGVDENSIFQDISKTIYNAIERIYTESPELVHITQKALSHSVYK
jgi:glutamate dehydrogenase/leucine dehydrogenase